MLSKKKSLLWADQEDQVLSQLVEKLGKKWTIISQQMTNVHKSSKSAKQCRQRWYNHVNPNICNQDWTQQQEDIIFQQHQKYGSKWKKIAEKLQGRSDNSIKNYFYSTVRKILRRINKYLGQKNGTAKIKKIKSSTISSIFSEGEGKQHRNSQNLVINSQISKCKQIAYHLVNFSRKKLSQSRSSLSEDDMQKFSLLLQQMMKQSNFYEQERLQSIKEYKIKSSRQLSTRTSQQQQQEQEYEIYYQQQCNSAMSENEQLSNNNNEFQYNKNNLQKQWEGEEINQIEYIECRDGAINNKEQKQDEFGYAKKHQNLLQINHQIYNKSENQRNSKIKQQVESIGCPDSLKNYTLLDHQGKYCSCYGNLQQLKACIKNQVLSEFNQYFSSFYYYNPHLMYMPYFPLTLSPTISYSDTNWQSRQH